VRNSCPPLVLGALRTIPFGPFANPRREEGSREQARRSFGLAPDDCAVLHLGNIVPYKGADLLLLTAEHVPSDTKMRILAVGAFADDAYGELLQRLADGLAERVPPADNSRPRYAWGYPR